MKTGKENYMQPECEAIQLRSERNFCQSQNNVRSNTKNEGVTWEGSYE